MARPDEVRHPHGGQRVLLGGAALESAKGGLIAIHGRGAGAEDIIALAREVAPPGVTILAPQAAGNTWYPYRFLEPTERNEPYLSSALRIVAELIAQLGDQGIPSERVALLGFSQGACLALEAAARNARRYAGVIGFSGGLIGPPGTSFDFPGSLDRTPVFLGCSDVDPHIPKERVEESAAALERLGAAVDVRLYPGMGHTVNRDELEAARSILGEAFAPSGGDRVMG
ncbi:MAG: Phospholipase/Carboxylesterase [Thermomicrobiales bacterium]|nr:Phospholipase/Carboxylesterase [Thermomicrobiales bacterium]MDF2758698.1 Phospholipase/Carboxylesterase [Thermomicrobiales bacterium]MDF3016907.1 Phospholipase/Carboxylesterase [Thermomicrobiales bacterium]